MKDLKKLQELIAKKPKKKLVNSLFKMRNELPRKSRRT